MCSVTTLSFSKVILTQPKKLPSQKVGVCKEKVRGIREVPIVKKMYCKVCILCSQANQEPLANPFGDQILMEIQTQVAEILISRTSYVKKLLEDCNNSEDTTKLLRVS